MATFGIREAADLLGVSDDTVRRWAESGRLPTHRGQQGRIVVEGTHLAEFARELAAADGLAAVPAGLGRQSARNRLRGIVTRVVKDSVMAQVDLQAGPFRLVSLMSREAADELGLEPGVVAVASVKSTQVVIEIPGDS
ncbi:MAG: helix-turn-helix transcriptional regulator [Geodermatophilaceae bacterium]|nr:helix-turn-helix transcriptional regulator [Geodermatophilaceae bacterium]MDQ3465364.1 helix-turn-helix transcriptional regulator [Actinomycetota bacterium]